jgi:hypothetical protein
MVHVCICYVIFSNRNLFSVVVTKETEQVVTIIVLIQRNTILFMEVACDGAEIERDCVMTKIGKISENSSHTSNGKCTPTDCARWKPKKGKKISLRGRTCQPSKLNF